MDESPIVVLTHVHYSGIPAFILLALLIWASYEALIGRLERSRRLLRWAALTAVAAWIVYTIPFVLRDYTLKPVYESTSLALPDWLLPATTWSTSGGSLYLFAVIAAIAVYLVTRSIGDHRYFLAAAPWLSASVLLSAIFYGAFELNPHPQPTGMGLNPLLKSFWLYPHPVTTFSGYALLAVAGFAIALGLRSRTITTIYEVGWALLTLGIMLGGYWSYETFGWGGYWAWDPVETSELMVWLAATTLPHVLIALPTLTSFTATLLSSTVYLAMFATRTGLSPLHSFASAGIASLILLAASLVLMGLSLYNLALNLNIAGVVSEARRWLRSPTSLGLGVATVTLLAATFFVTGSLLLPSLRVAAGLPASVPTMASGVRFYHPVLYPISLALLAGITITFLGDRLGWRGSFALLLGEAIVAAILAYRVTTHSLSLAPLSPLTTNLQMAIGIVFAGGALAALAAFLAMRAWQGLRRLMRDRYFGIALIHLGFVMTLLGVYLGGTYAFNEAYFQQYSLKPGDAIKLPGGQILVFKGYEYGIIDKPVDIFTPYAGRFPTYYLAQEALLTIHFDMAALYSQYERGKAIWNSTPLAYFQSLVGKTLHMDKMVFCGEGCHAVIAERSVEVQGHGTSLPVLRIEARNATLILSNVTLRFQLEPWQTGSNVRGLVAAIYINASNATLYAPNVSSQIDLGPHIFYLVSFDNYTVFDTKVGKLRIKAISFFVLPESLRKREARKTNDTVVFGSVLAYVVDGVLEAAGGVRVPIGLANPLPPSAAIYMLVKQHPLLMSVIKEVEGSSLARLLSNPSALFAVANYTKCPSSRAEILQLSTSSSVRIEGGCVKAPKFVPATAYVKLIFEVVDEKGRRLATIPAVLRYEVNGEVQGIHGLVSKVLHATIGVTDVYIAVHPPSIMANFSFLLPTGESYKPVFHDLVVYYLHEAFKRVKDPGERLALAALLAAGLHINDPTLQNPNLRDAILEADTLGLYLMAEKYSVDRSPIKTEGLNVEIKLIPGAPLVWWGSVIMSAAAIISAITSTIAARGQTTGTHRVVTARAEGTLAVEELAR